MCYTDRSDCDTQLKAASSRWLRINYLEWSSQRDSQCAPTGRRRYRYAELINLPKTRRKYSILANARWAVIILFRSHGIGRTAEASRDEQATCTHNSFFSRHPVLAIPRYNSTVGLTTLCSSSFPHSVHIRLVAALADTVFDAARFIRPSRHARPDRRRDPCAKRRPGSVTPRHHAPQRTSYRRGLVKVAGCHSHGQYFGR